MGAGMLALGGLGMIPCVLACCPCYLISSICSCVMSSKAKKKVEGFTSESIFNEPITLLYIIAAIVMLILTYKMALMYM